MVGLHSRVAIQLEEYRQLYALALYRLEVLDQRIPLACAALGAMLASVIALPAELQWAMLLGSPLSLRWLVRTTITHACSFEDALRRIEELERSVNRQCGHRLLGFQSRHPSRRIRVGGRTGYETVRAVTASSLFLMVAAGLWTSCRSIDSGTLVALTGYFVVISTGAFLDYLRYTRYRYLPAHLKGTDMPLVKDSKLPVEPRGRT